MFGHAIQKAFQPPLVVFLPLAPSCYTVILGADDGVAKSDGGDVGGTWLQLMCCALPKCLCP